ncbi:MAG: D-alanyl-D-alanine carboxypeptidase [Proteobacteria bacterium]|nr:D-alanyl-D-alanine carboxypeptidase [Pseudomonadota bacterium]
MRKILLLYLCIIFSIINAQSECDIIGDPAKYASIIIDADTGEVLHECNARELRFPASLTKMMTLYITFDAVQSGKLKLYQQLTLSEYAASQERSNMDLMPYTKVSAIDAIFGIVIKSANDFATMIGEFIGGDEEGFVRLMNLKAKRLGMHSTTFKNANGLPNKEQVTTAYDMALLARALWRDHSRYFSIFSKKSFVFNGKKFVGHNYVLSKYQYANGLKTGYIKDSDFNIATTAARKSHGNLVAVVMGGKTPELRDAHVMELLDRAYEYKIQKKSSKAMRFISKKMASYESYSKDKEFNKLENSTPAPSKADKEVYNGYTKIEDILKQIK